MPGEPDLFAELDAAEAIMTGAADRIETEWGVRYLYSWRSDEVRNTGSGEDGEKVARMLATDRPDSPRPLVRRTVIYGPWEQVPGE